MNRLLACATAFLLATAAAACTDEPLDTADVVESPLSWADTSSRASFTLWKSGDGQFRFRMNDVKGAIVATSEGYTSRTAALTGLLSVLDNGGKRGQYDVRQNASGGGYWNLRAANTAIIATSPNLPSVAAATTSADAAVTAIAGYRSAWATATGRRFALSLDAGGKYYWNLHAGNGEIVLRSQRYDGEAAALNGAFSVLDNGATKARYQVLAAANGGYYVNLTATNGQVLGTSEVYSTKSNAERARDAMVALVPTIVLL